MVEAKQLSLSSLAKKYLSILATSVPSERAFSLTGHVMNKKRASLLPDTVNTLAFLRVIEYLIVPCINILHGK